MMNIDVMEEVTRGSDEGHLPFPEVLAKIGAAGIERYHADLRRSERTYYLPDGGSRVVQSILSQAHVAEHFSAEGVAAAVAAIQKGEILYPEFCERIAAAGCAGYLVSLPGRRAAYYGRSAEFHVEHFPPATRP